MTLEANNPNPADDAENRSININPSWESDGSSFDVYFGTTSPLDSGDLVSEGQSDKFYEPGTLDYEEEYFWRIDTEFDADDSFTGDNGSAPDPDRWTLDGSPEIQDNTLEVGAAEKVISTFEVGNDFSIQVDVEATVAPATNSWAMILEAIIDSTHYAYISLAYTSSGKKWFRAYNAGSGDSYGSASRTPDSGKLKITRSGSNWTLSYYDGSWHDLSTGLAIGSGNIIVKLRVGYWDSNPTTEIAHFDNFLVYGSSVVYPVEDPIVGDEWSFTTQSESAGGGGGSFFLIF